MKNVYRSMTAGLNPNPNSLYLNIIWIIRTGTDIAEVQALKNGVIILFILYGKAWEPNN
ncbi:hypothetical protein KFK09_010536 [Dendrobium nobile]|uniref:Uncharacterized protein n=1 Tax=Dendrobium nobile TaxID=94219 RepID=A0A8T3BAA0_DENNO|nr:hypothetical protein KFK09_010536 [Dendrobium nobile]